MTSVAHGFAHPRSTQDELHDRIAGLQRHLELDHDVTGFQPPQASVVDVGGNTKIVLLNTPELRSKYHDIQLQQQKREAAAAADFSVGASVSAGALHGVNFRVSTRYRCLANPDGQVARGMGFVYEGMDLAEGTKVSWGGKEEGRTQHLSLVFVSLNALSVSSSHEDVYTSI